MNIIEAIKSGRKYRRKGEKGWYHPPANFSDYNFKVEAILANDWEVEDVAVTISREQFDAAWRRAEDVCENMQIKTRHYLYELIVRELGL